jgi:nucleoporin NUP42
MISSFGAAKHEPNLFFGYDTSQEEMRWKSVQALKAGQAQGYVSGDVSYWLGFASPL